MLDLALLLSSIFMEIYDSNNLNKGLLTNSLTSCLNDTLIIFYFLYHFSEFKIRIITVSFLNFFRIIISFYLQSFFYDPLLKIPVSSLLLNLLVIVSLYFSKIGQIEVNYLKKSYVFNNLIFEFLLPLTYSYTIYYHMKAYINYSLNINDFNNILIDLIIAYVIIELPYVIATIYRKLRSISNKQSSISFASYIMKTFIFISLVYVLYIINYLPDLSNKIYSLLMNNISNPYNVIIYNSVPLNPDSRFRIIILILSFLKRKIIN